MFELAYPWMLVLLPAPLLVWLILPPYRERRTAVRIPFMADLAEATGQTPRSGGVVVRRNWLQALVAPLVWALLVIAVARPQVVDPPITKVTSARDLMLTIDLSGSMDTPDMLDAAGERITRLDAAKQVVGDFIERREADRIGIVVFGTQAFVQTPFTQDHDLVRALLEQLEPGIAGPQTMLGDGIGLSLRAFQQSEAEERVVVMLTDGSDTGSKVPPRRAAEIAGDEGVTIHTIAIGDPTAVGEAEMDLETLDVIAGSTGGRSFSADDREQLEDIYREIDLLTPEELETASYRPTRPLFQWPTGAALALLLMYVAGAALRAYVRQARLADA